MNQSPDHHSPIPQQQTRPSAFELVSEVSDLAVGAGIFTFALARFALPMLALTALAVRPALIPMLVGATMAAPILAIHRWRGSRDRLSRTLKPDTPRHAGVSWRKGFAR